MYWKNFVFVGCMFILRLTQSDTGCILTQFNGENSVKQISSLNFNWFQLSFIDLQEIINFEMGKKLVCCNSFILSFLIFSVLLSFLSFFCYSWINCITIRMKCNVNLAFLFFFFLYFFQNVKKIQHCNNKNLDSFYIVAIAATIKITKNSSHTKFNHLIFFYYSRGL